MAAGITGTDRERDGWSDSSAVGATGWTGEPFGAAPTVNDLELDAQLVERCLNGDESAWEDLVKAHTRRVYAICYRFTGNESEAQDLTQDVFLRVFKSREELPGRRGIVRGVADAADAEPADRQLPADEDGAGDGFD